MSLRVEMIGLPGSGKTTLCDLAVSKLRDRKIVVIDREEQQRRLGALHARRPRAERALSRAAFVARHPELALAGARLTAHYRPPSARAWYRLWCLVRHAGNEDLYRESYPHDLLVLDQDLLQEVWSLAYLRSCTNEPLLDAVLRSLGPRLPQLVVLVETPAEIACERLRARTRMLGPMGDFERRPDLSVEDFRVGWREARRVAEAARRIGGAELVRLDASDAGRVDEQAEILASAIARRSARETRRSESARYVA